MRIRVEADHLASALGVVKSIVERSNAIPIISTCLVSAGGGKLSVAGTNTDIWGYVDVPCEGEGSVCIPLWLLESACIKGREVLIETDGKRATLTAGRSRFEGGVLPPSDFPTTDPKFSASGPIDGKALAAAMSFVTPAISTEKTRFFLCGILLEASNGFADLTATDGDRLLSIRIPCAFDIPPSIIPAKACAELIRLAADNETVTLEVGEYAIALAAGSARIVSKLIEGTFPAWRRVVPEKASAFIRVDTADAVAALSRIAKAIAASGEESKARGRVVALETGAGVLTVTRPYVVTETLPAETVGDVRAMSTNATSLRDALAALGALGVETAIIDMADPSSPFRIWGDDSATVVVMTMHPPVGWVPQENALQAAE